MGVAALSSGPRQSTGTLIDYVAELNEQQLAAVTSPGGASLVIAGAGSGKTRTLTYRVAWLLENGIKPWNILLLTFTNKAAREMTSRVSELLGPDSDGIWGGTYHSIGNRILRRHAEAIGFRPSFTILDREDQTQLLKSTARDAGAPLKDKRFPKADVLAELFSLSSNTGRPLEEIVHDRFGYFEGITDTITKVRTAYERRKKGANAMDFDDLLIRTNELLRGHSEVAEHYREQFRHVLVDEYQDTNLVQSDLVHLLGSKHGNIMVVGDDAQSIYSWRGANFENILKFPERYEGARTYQIETNYRSSPQILEFANAVLSAQPAGMGYSKELRPVRPDGEKPYFTPVMDARGQANFIIQRIEGLIDEGRDLSEVAVLYRAHYQAMDLQMELTRRGIDYQITSGVRFFEQSHIRDFSAQLRFASNPADVSAFARFTCLLPKVGPKTAERIHAFTKKLAEKEEKDFCEVLTSEAVLKKVPNDAKEEWPSLAETLREVSVALTSETPEAIVQLALDGWYSSFIREIYPNWTERADDLQSLISFASRFDTMQELLSQLVLLASESNERDSTEALNCLRLTTIHQAKGLEFPIVFVIGLADGLFPLKRTIDDGDLEEERRLFYVAVTRAMEELYLSYPMLNQQGNTVIRLNPSRFVQEVDVSRYETLRVAPTRSW